MNITQDCDPVFSTIAMNSNSDKPVVWLKLGKHFIDENNVRGISRKGKGTVIQLVKGEDLFVNIGYEKVIQLLPKNKNR